MALIEQTIPPPMNIVAEFREACSAFFDIVAPNAIGCRYEWPRQRLVLVGEAEQHGVSRAKSDTLNPAMMGRLMTGESA